MSYDSRFPTMHPIDRPVPGLSHWDWKEARRVGGEVARRTGTTCFFNSRTGKLIWVYGESPSGGPLGVHFRNRDGSIVRYDSGRIDDMVRYIGMGKISRREKDRIATNNTINEQKDAELARERQKGEMEKDIVKHATFLDRKRRGVATTAVRV